MQCTRPRSLTGLASLLCFVAIIAVAPAVDAAELKLLFLGDNGHHRPADRFRQLAPALEKRRIELTYTDDVNSLQADTLDRYDGLIVYANIDEISPAQAAALFTYVESGKGFIPLHCATYCFRNSPEVVALMGGQFKRHGTGVFATQIAPTEHPIMKGFHGFTSWDESYIHHLHNEENRVVLEYRVEGPQEKGQTREPWTWIRTHGEGRVFYTAWGHDERTWGQPGFQNLIERGIRWACRADLSDVPDFDAPFKAAVNALSHPSAGVRRNAVGVLPLTKASSAAIVSLGLLRDDDPQVRLAAALALADMPEDNDAGQAIAELVREPATAADRWIADSLTTTAAAHATPFLLSLADPDVQMKDESDPLGGKSLPIATIVAEHFARGRPAANGVEAIVAGIAKSDSRLVGAVLEGFVKGWPQSHRLKVSRDAEKSLVALLERASSGSKAQLLQLASLWGSKELEKHAASIVKALLDTVRDDVLSADDRAAAANQLIRFRADDNGVVASLLELVTLQTAPDLAAKIIDSISASTAPEAGVALTELAAETTPGLRDQAIRVLLSRPRTTIALLDGIKSGQISLTDLKLDQKQALSNHPDKQLQARAKKLLAASGGLPNPDREKVLQEKLRLVKLSGNVVLGKEVFKKQCAKCHKHGGEGENIGPDLTGMAVHPKTELLTHILDPSRSVEGNFSIYTILTDAGRVYTGMLASETRTSLELIDAEAKRHAIQRSEIDELVSSRKSLMPEGFEKQASDQDIVNLLEFLTAKGRYVPLDLRKVATSVSTRGMFVNEKVLAEALIFPDWTPKVFEGVPFQLVDPQGTKVPNAVLLYGPNGTFAPNMPRQVSLPVNTAAKSIHLLSGVSGWGSPFGEHGSVSMIVRLRYADGETEDHALKNGIHFSDYIRRVDVPESKFAWDLRGKQIRYLAVQPNRDAVIEELQFVKGPDDTAPVVMAITVETRNAIAP